jgi:hypothetical protein
MLIPPRPAVLRRSAPLLPLLLGLGCTTPEMFMPSAEELVKIQKAMDAKNNPPKPVVRDMVGCDLAKQGLESVFPGALIREYQPSGKDSCGYAIDGPRSELGTDVVGHLRAPFASWTEDKAAAVDSEGGTTFRFGDGRRLCTVQATWDGKGAPASTYFKVESVCAPDPKAPPADPAAVPAAAPAAAPVPASP